MHGREFHCQVRLWRICLVFECLTFLLSLIQYSLCYPFSGQFIPDAPPIAPPPLVFPSRVVLRVCCHSRCLCLGARRWILHTLEEGPTVQLCGDGEVAGKWTSGFYSVGQKYRGRSGQIQKHCIHGRWKKIAPDLKGWRLHQAFSGNNQQADHWANLCAEG